jgi:lysophospholipid acyltransferase (LPLAT)-like uncharacterized protein
MGLKYRFRQIKRYPHRLYYPIAWFLRLWHATLRTRTEDPHGVVRRRAGGEGPLVIVVWHNRMLFFALAVARRERLRSSAVISPSRDGQYLADLLRCFGVGAIRGSSRKEGLGALLDAVAAIGAGRTVVFTPDGPRGPRYRMSNGPIALAMKTGRPIVPVAINASSCWQLRSWDRFQIPKPFSKLTLVVGEPLQVPPDLPKEQVEAWRARVEAAVNALVVDPA